MSLQYWNLYISWLKPWTAILAMCLHLDGKFSINLATLFIVPSWRHPSPGCLRGHPSLLAVQALLGSLNP
ncbi:hypothetical protein Gotri_001688 [Gossypium trilobum]|uniref:Uncharacterized protein n=1 Tax=Gossypium trilobum TaxID=34281 RepID=A0A7J9FHM0_9ROSI|nr:hypothetical protein [Gossypium trilobum]